jgi:hypothetical protein
LLTFFLFIAGSDNPPSTYKVISITGNYTNIQTWSGSGSVFNLNVQSDFNISLRSSYFRNITANSGNGGALYVVIDSFGIFGIVNTKFISVFAGFNGSAAYVNLLSSQSKFTVSGENNMFEGCFSRNDEGLYLVLPSKDDNFFEKERFLLLLSRSHMYIFFCYRYNWVHDLNPFTAYYYISDDEKGDVFADKYKLLYVGNSNCGKLCDCLTESSLCTFKEAVDSSSLEMINQFNIISSIELEDSHNFDFEVCFFLNFSV